jgi:hypothetical protein
MYPKIHCVVEQPQDLDLMLIRSDAEQDEVPAFAAASRHVQREQPLTDLCMLAAPFSYFAEYLASHTSQPSAIQTCASVNCSSPRQTRT